MSQPTDMKNESQATKPLLQAIDLKNTIRSKRVICAGTSG